MVKAQNMINLSVIVVLYNEYELVKKSLASVYKQNIPEIEIILVNNSSDLSGLNSLLKKFSKIKYIRSKNNLGFADGVNLGIDASGGEYILILTPDMYLLPDTIKLTLNYIKKNKNVGLVGCRIYTSPNHQVQSATNNFPNLKNSIFYFNLPIYKLIHRFYRDYIPNFFSKKEHEKILFPKNIRGEYMLIRKKTIDKIGKFDNQFFLYFEDFDFSKRVNDNGWKVVYLPVGGVVQNGLTKWKKTKITQALPPYLTSFYKYYLKYNGKFYTIAVWLLSFISVIISIPYLIIVILFKSLINKKSQASELLPLWVDIAKWHITKGLKIIF